MATTRTIACCGCAAASSVKPSSGSTVALVAEKTGFTPLFLHDDGIVYACPACIGAIDQAVDTLIGVLGPKARHLSLFQLVLRRDPSSRTSPTVPT